MPYLYVVAGDLPRGLPTNSMLLAHSLDHPAAISTGVLIAAIGLGAFHGLNPGMGWLFATSFGLQEKSRWAIVRSMLPIAVGHELSVLPIAVAISVFASQVVRAVAVTVLAVVLVGFGAYLLLRKRHFKWVGMRLSAWQLAWWSFLMSTATGAGLMLAPVLTGAGISRTDLVESALSDSIGTAVLAGLVHGLAMLIVATCVALAVYSVFGLRILRSAWINLDRIWALAFIGAGVFVWFA